MDIAGARWGLPGAEAILRIHAAITNGNFDNLLDLAPDPRTPPHPPQRLPKSHHGGLTLTPEEPHPIESAAR